MSSIETTDKSINKPSDFGSTESHAVDPFNNDSASVASHKSADADISGPIANPWSFDRFEDGHFQIHDRHIAGFNDAVKGFYRNLTESGYVHLQYSVLSFKSADAMAFFVRMMPEMQPAMASGDEGPLVHLSMHDAKAAIWESRWSSSAVKKALKEKGIYCVVDIYHIFQIAFTSEKEARHFGSDCDAYDVKWGTGKYVAPKFQVSVSTPVDPATVEGIYLNEADRSWTARRNYKGCEFGLGPFDNRAEAAKACSQFDFLVSMIPK
jgi:hypothetical protein